MALVVLLAQTLLDRTAEQRDLEAASGRSLLRLAAAAEVTTSSRDAMEHLAVVLAQIAARQRLVESLSRWLRVMLAARTSTLSATVPLVAAVVLAR